MGAARLFAAAILGLLYTFAGYRWIRLTTRLASAMLFAGIAGSLAQDRVQPLFQLGLMLAAGVLGFLLGNVVYYLVVFLYGAAAGALLAAAPAGGTAHADAWILLAGAAAGGLLALLFERPLLIVASSVLGSFLLAGLVELPRSISLLAWGALALLGIVVQAWTTPRPLPATTDADVRRPPPL
jgi:hypothetical protein